MWYGYTPEQHAAVDSELEKMWTRLIEMAVGINKLAAPTNRQGSTYMSACAAANAVRYLRDSLAQSLQHQQEGEEIRRRLGKQ